MKIVILGSGISGLSCSYHLFQEGIKAIIYEKDNDWGGLCNNFIINGFRFDKFVHFTFTKNDYIKNIFESSSKCILHKPESSNYYKGLWLRHPIQNNLYPLTLKEKIRIITSFIDKKDQCINNYEDWLRTQYGDYFSEKFPMKYTSKYWTVQAKELETKWIGDRMNKPSIEEILEGALTPHEKNNYYTNEMRYPEKGGYKSILNNIRKDLDIKFNKEVIKIDPHAKLIYFKDSTSTNYDHLISSIPLPSIIKAIENIPKDIKNAINELLHTSGYIISLGFNKPNIAKKLWFYIYDKDILPSRVYSPSMKSLDNVPYNCSSLQAEIYFSKQFKINMSQEELLEHTINKLKDMNIFKDEDLIVKDIRKEDFANVVFTHKIYENREIVKSYLNSLGIDLIGRFGEWDYLWSDQSFLSGKEIADKIIKKVKYE